MKIVIFGYGFTARAFAQALLKEQDAAIIVTVRSLEKAERLREDGVTFRLFSDAYQDKALNADIATANAVIISIPPSEQGDVVLAHYENALAASASLKWIGYLSTTGVYGDHQGAWVDENTAPKPSQSRTIRRLETEKAWQNFGMAYHKAVTIFRLSGIYGKGRNALLDVLDGSARRLIKKDQVFNRIHGDDIAQVLHAALHQQASGIYNVADDCPCASEEVIAYAAKLLGKPIPPALAFEEAVLSPMARSFYSENKRVANQRMKTLSITLLYPTYKEGLETLLTELEPPAPQRPD
jgi:nucleoside-diphosphate-sugar epimerase